MQFLNIKVKKVEYLETVILQETKHVQNAAAKLEDSQKLFKLCQETPLYYFCLPHK